MSAESNKQNVGLIKQAPSITRKAFLKQSSLSLLGLNMLSFGAYGANLNRTDASNVRKSGYDTNEGKLRSIAYNTFNGCIGYKGINGRQLPPDEDNILLKSARDMGQIPQRIMLELALYKPNIISFSESADENVVAEMAKMLNLNYTFFPGAKNGRGHFPGSILTTYEIISSENRPFVNKSHKDREELFTRHWGKAKLRLPDGNTVTVHSAHLWPFAKDRSDTQIRFDEIRELVASIKRDLVSKSDSVLLQGDLNHTPDTAEYNILKAAGLVDAFALKGNGEGFTANSIKLSRRIDYIYAIGSLSRRIKYCASLFQGNFRMNANDPKGFALSDHIPVLADFEL